MKKTYIKPMLSKESFAMTESVATGCGNVAGIEADFNTPESCSWQMMGEDPVFLSANVCTEVASDPTMYCYNGMSGGMPVFRS